MLFHTYRRELLSEESGPQWIHVPREETLDDKRCFFDRRLRGRQVYQKLSVRGGVIVGNGPIQA